MIYEESNIHGIKYIHMWRSFCDYLMKIPNNGTYIQGFDKSIYTM